MASSELTPRQAARRIGCSIAHLYKLVEQGHLPPPRKDTAGGRSVRLFYDAAAVAACPWKRQRARLPSQNVGRKSAAKVDVRRGKIAAAAFRLIADMLRAGKEPDWRLLVIKLEIAPDLARELVTEYNRTAEDERAEAERKHQRKLELMRERETQRTQRLEGLKTHQRALVRTAASAGVAPQVHIHVQGEQERVTVK